MDEKNPFPGQDAADLLQRIHEFEEAEKQYKNRIDELTNELSLLRTLFDTMPDFIFIKDDKSRFILNNKAHLAILGASSQKEIVGKTDLDIFPKSLSSRYFSDEQLVLQCGKSVINREEPVTNPDGTTRWFSTTKMAVPNDQGNVIGLVGISRDITDKKQLEESLKKAKEELEQRVEERTIELKSANEALAQRISQLNFLTSASHSLSQYIELTELGNAIVATFTYLFPYVQSALCIHHENGFSILAATSGFPKYTGQETDKVEQFHGLCSSAIHEPVVVANWQNDNRFKDFTSPECALLPCYALIPLLSDNRYIGAIHLFTRADDVAKFTSELPVLSTLASHAATCLSNAIHFNELDKQARIRAELDAAQQIQLRFIPDNVPPIPHVLLKGVYFPANEVGGDYLDYFQTDEGNWIIAIADVCGKGIPAALFMIMLRSAYRLVGRNAHSAKELLLEVNTAMKTSINEQSFITTLCCIISKDGRSMTYARAGHPKLIRIPGTNEDAYEIDANGLALGLSGDDSLFTGYLNEVTVPLIKGDHFLMFTDGLPESNYLGRSEYGTKRLIQLLSQNKDKNPAELIATIIANLNNFTHNNPAHDDLTMLAMEII